MKRIAFFLIFLSGISATAQENLFQQYKEKYKEEPAIFLKRTETISITVKDDSLDVQADEFEEILHLKEQSDGYANRAVHGSYFGNITEITGKTLVLDKGKYKEQKVANFLKKTDDKGSVFYDDSYYYSFSFPSVAPGNKTQLAYKTRYRDARFIPAFMAVSYMPQVSSVFTIKASKEIDLQYEILNDDKGLIKFNQFEKGNTVYYEWSVENSEAYKFEDNSPTIRYFAPHVLVHVKSFKTSKGVVKNVLSNLDDLYAWYGTFLANLNNEPSGEMKKIVTELKAASKTELDLVKNIFYWVQENIRYIAFEDGMRGFIPHNGAYVCEKRYGDCKDMANLIVAMLQEAGVKAYHTWIGTRDLPYSYSNLPTPMVDNHMIATYISSDNRYYFLDATSNYTPFGFPSSMIQGKEALIGKSPTEYEVKKVPVLNKEQNVMYDSVYLQITDNELRGTGTIALHGYAKVFGGYELDRSREDDVKRYVTKLTSKGSNKFFLDNYSIKDLSNRDLPTRIDYQFRIGDYFQRVGDEVYVNMNLNKDYYNAYINTNLRKTPRENEYQYVKEEVSVLNIPEGYEPEYIPANTQHGDAPLGFDVRYEYEVKNSQIIFRKKFYLDFLILQPEQFSKWNESVKRVSETYRESIILKKK